jgi:C1A family cysteine protease
MSINFGYIEDGPGKDLKYEESSMILEETKLNPSLKQYFKPISDQYYLSACVANAVADSFEAQIAHRANKSPLEIEDLSRLFIYWNARNLDTPSSNEDKGSRIRLALDAMARYGAPSEKTYPYDMAKVNERPTILAYREAIKNRISKFYKISEEDVRVEQIKQAISCGNPVIFGTKITNSFRTVNDDSIIMKPEDGWIGAHCMCIVGWSEDRQAFEIRNSWGENWGVKGYCWMDKEYIASNVTTDIWAATL